MVEASPSFDMRRDGPLSKAAADLWATALVCVTAVATQPAGRDARVLDKRSLGRLSP